MSLSPVNRDNISFFIQGKKGKKFLLLLGCKQRAFCKDADNWAQFFDSLKGSCVDFFFFLFLPSKEMFVTLAL